MGLGVNLHKTSEALLQRCVRGASLMADLSFEIGLWLFEILCVGWSGGFGSSTLETMEFGWEGCCIALVGHEFVLSISRIGDVAGMSDEAGSCCC